MSRNTIPKTLRIDIWETYIGKIYESKCFCCKTKDIQQGNFECGHVKSIKDGGGTTIENLRPICSTCNRSMGRKNMYDFMSVIYPDKYEEEYKKYLQNLNNEHFEFLCNLIKIKEEKYKRIITEIMKKYKLHEIHTLINTKKYFLVKCYTKKCQECKFVMNENNIIKCECGSRHYYYTNSCFTKKQKCKECKSLNIKYIKNRFINKQITNPKSIENPNDKIIENQNTKLTEKTDESIDKYDLIYSKINYVKINNDEIPKNKHKYMTLLLDLLSRVSNKIMKNKYFESEQERTNDNRFKYYNELDMSIKFKYTTSKKILEAIILVCKENKINIEIQIELDEKRNDKNTLNIHI